MNDKILIYYRVSNNSYNKVKPHYVTKLNCLTNFIKNFSEEEIHIVGDNLTDVDIKTFILSNTNLTFESTNLGNAASFKYCLDKCIKMNDENRIVYFVEDDYIHRKNSSVILKEGINLGADFVSLYDHPDKYMDGINPYVEDGGEETKVFLSKSCHWKFSNSTTMTFASKIKTLQETYNVIQSFVSDSHPQDFQMFLKLRELGKSLITSIPGYSTHGESAWLTPLINWETEL